VMKSFLDWIGHAPAWLTQFGSALGAAGGVYAWIVSRRDKSLEQQRALDNDWFRVLIFEQALPPTLLFLTQQRASFAAIAGDPARRHVPAQYDVALQAFKQSMVVLQRTVLVVQVLSPETYEDAVEILDEMDDAVTVHCAANSGFSVEGHADFKSFANVDRRMSELTVELFSSLRELHADLQERPTLWQRTWSWICGLRPGGKASLQS